MFSGIIEYNRNHHVKFEFDESFSLKQRILHDRYQFETVNDVS